MKRIIMAAMLCLCCAYVNAQVIEVYKNGELEATYTNDESNKYKVIFKEVSKTTYTINGVEYPMPDYVDLGLPSGTLWATCNVGAMNPEDYGLYFAWGETTGYTSDTSDGHSFYWTDYKWCNGTAGSITKYCTDSEYGIVDNRTELESSDDAATANLGSNWQMPSMEQIQEIYNSNNTYTTTTWTTENGVFGRKITSKSNGNSIFLPAEGSRYLGDAYDVGSEAGYWSRTLCLFDVTIAYGLSFSSRDDGHISSAGIRCSGSSVRPVRVQK